jgi:hypothetical protein
VAALELELVEVAVLDDEVDIVEEGVEELEVVVGGTELVVEVTVGVLVVEGVEVVEVVEVVGLGLVAK